MPDRTYRLVYDTTSSLKAASDIDALTAALTRLDQVADKIAPKLRVIARGLDKNASEGATAVNKLTVACAQLNPVASNSADAMKALNDTVKDSSKHLDASSTSSTNLGRSIIGVSAAALGMRAVREVTSALREAFEDAAKFAEETADKTLALKDAVRELKAVSGDEATLEQTTEGVKKIMLASGAKQSEAIAFETMWGSAISAAKKGGGWQLSDNDTEEVKIEAARFAVANGMNPDTVGKLVPSIGIAQPVKTKDDVLGQLSYMQKMGVESVGRFTPVMKANQRLLGSMVRPEGGGAFKSAGALMGAISASTAVSGSEAASVQMMKQVWRDLSMPMNDEASANMEKIGIVPGQDDYASSVSKLGEYLKTTRAQGIGDNQALKQFGFTRPASFAALQNAVTVSQATTKNVSEAETHQNPQRIQAISEQFRKDQPNRFAEARLEVAKLERGQENSDLSVMEKLAEAGLHKRREIDTAGMNALEAFDKIVTLGGLTGEYGKESQKHEDIRLAMQEVVPNALQRFPGALGAGSAFTGRQSLNEAVNQLAPAEREAVFGRLNEYAEGKLTPGARDENGELLNVNRSQLDELRKLNASRGNNGGASPSPANNGPVGGPPGPNVGGDFNPARN